MSFFDNIVLPQSADHIQLLHYLLILIQFLFLPFLGITLIGSFLSLRYWKKGLKENNRNYLNFSKDIIDIITVNKSLGAALGILPVITSILIYAQLLHKSNSPALIILLIALPLLIIGFVLIYVLKYSLTFKDFFESLKDKSALTESLMDRVKKFENSSNRLARKSGIIAFALLAVGSWYYISAITSAVITDFWMQSSYLGVLFSEYSILSFIQFILIASAITGSVILFAFFYWEGGREIPSDEYKNLVKNSSIAIILTSLIILPLIILINNLLLPKTILSGSIFTYLVIAIVLIFISYHLIYAITKTSNLKLSGQLFFVVIFLVLALVIKDQMAMSNSTKAHSLILSEDFNKYLAELKGESTSTIKIRSGEEIFTVVCSACHKFDEKLVGPPYNQVLTKYEGKMDDLIGFILNPVKVDPAYPPMPNQGLRREEAKNIAEYLMQQHSKSTSK